MNLGVAEAYFKELLCDALDIENIKLQQLTQNYIVELLSKSIIQEEFPALAFMFFSAQEGDRLQRHVAYRRLGDTALFVSGFFKKYVENTVVGLPYYIDMGSAAYIQASRLTTFGSPIYQELGNKFRHLVEVMIHMAEQTTLASNENIDSLLSRYDLEFNSKILYNKLITQKIVPVLPIKI